MAGKIAFDKLPRTKNLQATCHQLKSIEFSIKETPTQSGVSGVSFSPKWKMIRIPFTKGEAFIMVAKHVETGAGSN